jgi:hypothetical protein
VRHHADELGPADRDALFTALARVWPVRGPRKTSHKEGLVFRLLMARGVSSKDLAAKWHKARPGQVTDSARDHERQAERFKTARIVVSGYDRFDENESDASKDKRLEENPNARLPDDPGDQLRQLVLGDLAESEIGDPVFAHWLVAFLAGWSAATSCGRKEQGDDDENWRLADELARERGHNDLAGLLGLPSEAERRLERPLDDMSAAELRTFMDKLKQANIERASAEPPCQGSHLWRRYRNKAEALRALQTLQDDPLTRSALPLREYHCAACKGWHLTSEAEGEPAR